MINRVPPNWSTFLRRAKSMKIALPEKVNRCGEFLLTLKYQFLDSDRMRNVEGIAFRIFGKAVKR